MDDEHTLMWTQVAGPPDGRIDWLPNTTDWFGRFRITQGPENEFMLDRELQKSGTSYSGIPGGARPQDMAVTYSMGSIYNRSREHLGTTDQLIIRTRRRVINAAKALRDHGVTPPAVDNPELYQQRSGGTILPRSVDWWDGTRELRQAFVKHEGIKPLVGV
jgi:hypothetical protein